MAKKKYAIVCVSESLACPSHYENIENKFVCEKGKCNICRYGDTKEQLVAKVTQAITATRQKIKDGKYNFVTDKGLAQIIIEFLGIEE